MKQEIYFLSKNNRFRTTIRKEGVGEIGYLSVVEKQVAEGDR